MRIVFAHWKYIFKNIWFVLPFAVVPALFFALSLNFNAIESFLRNFFTGGELSFANVFRAWSLFRFDSALGIVYTLCTLVSGVFFISLMLAFVEKHMRIGKRTFSGVLSQLGNLLLPSAGILLLYCALYELWALMLSAMLYAVSALGAAGVKWFLFILLVVIFFAALLYLATVFYFWLPCMQITGMNAYHAFIYAYRLMTGVRYELILSFVVSFCPAYLVIWASSFLPVWIAVVIAFLLIVFLFMSFFIRMETFYFEADKIDREDLLLTYKEF